MVPLVMEITNEVIPISNNMKIMMSIGAVLLLLYPIILPKNIIPSSLTVVITNPIQDVHLGTIEFLIITFGL